MCGIRLVRGQTRSTPLRFAPGGQAQGDKDWIRRLRGNDSGDAGLEFLRRGVIKREDGCEYVRCLMYACASVFDAGC